MKDGMSLGERMKSYYEHRYKIKLPMRLPVIIRIDGKAFHIWTRKNDIDKPFDTTLIEIFNDTCKGVCKEIQGVQIAYLQSDEVSFLIHNYKSLNQQAWFDNNLQKLVSVSSSLFTGLFNNAWDNGGNSEYVAYFDSRAFVLPEEEVCNYFIWRQQDWIRNSLQMYARSFYSHKELLDKNSNDIHDLLHEKDVNWAHLSNELKNGRCMVKDEGYGWIVDNDIPIFTQDRNYIEQYLEKEE